MDNALNKVGLYDFVGVLLSGMILIMMSAYLELPSIFVEDFINDSMWETVVFF